jgi:hypothetical protein
MANATTTQTASKVFNIKRAVAPRDESPREIGGTLSDYLVDVKSTSISSSVKDVNATSKVTLRMDYNDDTRGLLFFSGPLSKELRAQTMKVSEMLDFPVQKFTPNDEFGNPIVDEKTGELAEIFVICRPEGTSRIDVTIVKGKKAAVNYQDLW